MENMPPNTTASIHARSVDRRTRHKTWTMLVAAVFCVPAFARPILAAQLVADGKPLAVLVTADEPTAGARSAAALIARTLEKMSGARLAIATESTHKGPLLPVYVGHTRFAEKKGIAQKNLGPEEIVLVVGDDHVMLLGNEGPAGPDEDDVQQGTYFAAVELLQRLGVRWLWPGPSGEGIPRSENVALGSLTYRHRPKVVSREFRIRVGRTGVDEMAPALKVKFGRANGSTGVFDWPANMRLGGSKSIRARHSFGTWYERFFETHPEWFARGGADGKTFGWMNAPERCKLCISQTGVFEQVVADAKKYYASVDNPKNASFSLTPNDNRAGFCMCDKCRALDHPQGRKVTLNFHTPLGNGRFKSSSLTHVSLTERYVKFWNRVAEKLDEDTPGMMVSSLAYSVYRAPPVETKLHPNLAIGYVAGGYTNEKVHEAFLEGWKAWSEKTRQMFWRPNSMQEGHGFPLVWATRMGKDIKMMVETGMVGVDMPNVHHHWGTQGLNYYVLAQMLWDHTQDPGKIIDDYCKAGFGAAASIVRRYYARLEDLTEQLARFGARDGRSADEVLQALDDAPEELAGLAVGKGPSAYHAIWTDQVLNELAGMLQRASRAVPAGSPEADRIAILTAGIDFAKRQVQVKRAFHEFAANPKDADARFNFLLALARAERWMYERQSTMAVGVVEGYPWWWKSMRAAQPVQTSSFMVKAKALSRSKYLVIIPGYSKTGKFVAVQFSTDGTSWSKEQPYAIDHEYIVKDRNAKSIQARLLLATANGRTWTDPVTVALDPASLPGG